MMWPRPVDLPEPGRSIVMGAVAVVQGLVRAGASEDTVALAVGAAHDVFEAVRDEADPQQAIGEFFVLEAMLLLSRG